MFLLKFYLIHIDLDKNFWLTPKILIPGKSTFDFSIQAWQSHLNCNYSHKEKFIAASDLKFYSLKFLNLKESKTFRDKVKTQNSK